jgi:hypothetical protein
MMSLRLSVATMVMAWLASAGLGAGGAAGTSHHGEINARQLYSAFTTKAELQTAVNSWCGSSAGVTSTEATYGPISAWDVSQVTDMSYLFYGKSTCNPLIGDWNTATVTNMDYMFYDASAYNQPIGNWNTAAVKKKWMACSRAPGRSTSRSATGTRPP